jgi:hypothetical protein
MPPAECRPPRAVVEAARGGPPVRQRDEPNAPTSEACAVAWSRRDGDDWDSLTAKLPTGRPSSPPRTTIPAHHKSSTQDGQHPVVEVTSAAVRAKAASHAPISGGFELGPQSSERSAWLHLLSRHNEHTGVVGVGPGMRGNRGSGQTAGLSPTQPPHRRCRSGRPQPRSSSRRAPRACR